jgi:hypothetical protein
MATVPLPLRGVDIVLVRTTVQSVNATTGLLSDSATIATITAKLAGVDVIDRITNQVVMPITLFTEHNVGTVQGMDVVLRELLERQASALPTTGPVLAKLRDTLILTSLIAKLEITRGGNTWTYYGTYDGYSERLADRAGLVGEMGFKPVAIGGPNPVYG